MKAQELLNEILPILYTVKEDPIKLEKILRFLMDEIYEEPVDEDEGLEEEDETQVPEKYRKAVAEIADGLDAGFFCFFNMDTLEVEDVPENLLVDLEEYEENKEDWEDELDLKYPTWENCMTFEPLESQESFKIMRKFTNHLKDKKLQNKLDYALNNRKPFANFKYHVDNSDYRQDWFDFKKHCMEVHVKELLSIHLERQDAKFDAK